MAGRLALLAVLLLAATTVVGKKANKGALEAVSELKEFKRVLRTKNNVLVLFTSEAKRAAEITRILTEVSAEAKGIATLLTVDCSDKEGKKLCKKLKVSQSASYSIKHYKDGDYHKDYDRAEKVKSFITFLKDPTGDLPWDEDPAASSVVHLATPSQLSKLLKTERGSVLAMFYAPWCGHCKRMKPDYQAAAAELRGSAVLAAMDVNRPENSPVRRSCNLLEIYRPLNVQVSRKYNISGFPTLLYFSGKSLKTVTG